MENTTFTCPICSQAVGVKVVVTAAHYELGVGVLREHITGHVGYADVASLMVQRMVLEWLGVRGGGGGGGVGGGNGDQSDSSSSAHGGITVVAAGGHGGSTSGAAHVAAGGAVQGGSSWTIGHATYF